MSAQTAEPTVRSGCVGVVPLTARLEPWQLELLGDPARLAGIVSEHGSPVNLLDPGPMERNAAELIDSARRSGTDLQIYFARKANKALALVDEARRLGLGIDLASQVELEQVLERGVPGANLMMTAAVKPAALLTRCLESGTTIAVDNEDELERIGELSQSMSIRAEIALRMAPDLGPARPQTRFGLEPTAWLDALARQPNPKPMLRVSGVHFHLDGYSVDDRVKAIEQALGLVFALRGEGHPIEFVDIGGGIPMSYLDDGTEWERFWAEHSQALAGRRDEVTFDNHELATVYPYHQAPVRGQWLAELLGSRIASGSTVAEELRSHKLRLRCEPGRSLLDGCGLTVARVEFRKQRHDGTWLIGLAMNRTQCRSTSDDFMADPLLVSAGDRPSDRDIEGYLVGAYCIERELLTLRRMRFPGGVAVGDLIVFPNTAGYLMHILESTSHQIPLARNLVLADPGVAKLDDIDQPGLALRSAMN